MKFSKKSLMAAAVFGMVSLGANAADVITFDPYGNVANTTTDLAVTTFDWLPGSALAVGVNSTTGIGGSFTTYYQANLGTVLNGGTPVYLNGGFPQGTAPYFTAVAGFGETVQTCSGTPCLNATFAFDGTNPVNFFQINEVAALGDNLNGTGFVGNTILSGHIVSSGFSSNFALASPQPSPLPALDSFSNDASWSGTSTVTGSGASSILVYIDSVNSAYFPDLMSGMWIAFSPFNTSQILAFNQVDPSHCLSDGVSDCAITSNVGSINGYPVGFGGGPDVIFQADGNQSFLRVVPEPGTLALLGIGLLGFAMLRRRNMA